MRKTTDRLVRSQGTRRLAVAAVCLSVVMGGGCKSSVPTWKTPSWGSLGFKREPSPDAIAGVGPTATYPLSPSANATPSAIQSVAASPSGVQPQTSQVAATNASAAVANGFAAKTPPASVPNGPVGSTPTYAATGTTGVSPASTYAAVGYPLPGASPSTPPPTGSVSQSLASAPPATASIGSATPPSLAGGFAMPSGTPATGQSSPTPSAGGFVMPSLGGMPVEGAGAPAARTASVAATSPTPSPSGVAPAGGYAPGSTSGATSYPTTSAGGTSDAGTFYR